MEIIEREGFIDNSEKEKVRNMRNVFYKNDNGEFLSNKEFNFCVLIAHTENLETSSKIFDIKISDKLISKLNTENYINTDFSHLEIIDKGFSDYLKKVGFRNSRNFILQKNKIEFIEKLKKKFKFIYPKYAIKNLLDKESLDKLIIKNQNIEKKINKAYHSFVNYLISESEFGKPIIALDFRESDYYKKFPIQKENDIYKKALLLECGILYFKVNYKTKLNEIEEYFKIIEEIKNKKE